MSKKGKRQVGHESGSEDEDITDAPTGLNTSELLKNPALLAAMQDKLQGLVGVGSGYIESLPQCIKGRINALKNIQVECAKIEGKFYEEAHELEMKYSNLFKPLFEKRSEIVNGLYEPSSEEATWIEANEIDEEKVGEKNDGEVKKDASEQSVINQKTDEEKITEEVKDKLSFDENTKGIPEFWLTAMKNVGTLSEMIQPHDEEILKHLLDIKLIFTGRKQGEESADDNEMGFVLEFHFSPNEFFTNEALTKTYKMKSEPDPEDPFSFEGPDIVGCTGCKIDWKKGKNVTQKVVKKKQKHKGRGQTRVVTKTVKTDSFFNFFDPPEIPEDEDEMDEDTEELLRADFEIGHFMRERLIPKAVLFFTGEAIEDDSDDEDEFEDEEGEEGEDDEEEDDEKDPEYKPSEKPQECKQQ